MATYRIFRTSSGPVTKRATQPASAPAAASMLGLRRVPASPSLTGTPPIKQLDYRSMGKW
jgi:hypothetical protein